MTEITPEHVKRLIEIESSVQYDASPTEGEKPFLVKNRKSIILISAPHGAKTYRETEKDGWHEEDEYTAGMALLLGEICNVSVIAMVSRSDKSDPNHHDESDSIYKQTLRELIETGTTKHVIDLHGAKENSDFLATSQLVDLGLGKEDDYLPEAHRKKLIDLIEAQLGANATDRNGKSGFPAASRKRIRVANFCHNLGVSSVQIEMKPELRVALRKEDSSAFKKEGKNYAAPQEKIMGMLQALTEFIEYLKEVKE